MNQAPNRIKSQNDIFPKCIESCIESGRFQQEIEEEVKKTTFQNIDAKAARNFNREFRITEIFIKYLQGCSVQDPIRVRTCIGSSATIRIARDRLLPRPGLYYPLSDNYLGETGIEVHEIKSTIPAAYMQDLQRAIASTRWKLPIAYPNPHPGGQTPPIPIETRRYVCKWPGAECTATSKDAIISPQKTTRVVRSK